MTELKIPALDEFKELTNVDAFNLFIKFADRTMNKELTKKELQLNCYMGLICEVHEVLDLFKKHLAQNKSLDKIKPKVLEEFGDVLWYFGNYFINFCEADPNTFEFLQQITYNYDGSSTFERIVLYLSFSNNIINFVWYPPPNHYSDPVDALWELICEIFPDACVKTVMWNNIIKLNNRHGSSFNKDEANERN